MKTHKLFEEFRKLNPWPVLFDGPANAVLDALVKAEEGKEEGEKSQKLLIDLISKAALVLKTFPPDDNFFTDPRPSLDNLHIWLVVSVGHKKVLVKAQYRLDEHICWITELGLKGA